MQNNNCQGVVDGGGRRTMLWFLPMLIVIFGTANQVVSEKMKFYENVLMVSSTVYRTELQATSHCSCRVKCILDQNCTAISAKRDDATGIVDCFYSSETKLKKDHFEDDESTNTWIKQSSSSGIDPSGSTDPQTITTDVSGAALSTGASNTATTGQTSGTDGQTTSPTGQTSSPTGQTSSPTGQTSSTIDQTSSTNSQTSSTNGQTTATTDQSTTGSSQTTATTTEVTTTATTITTPTTTIAITTAETCQSGYILIPGVGCFVNAGSKTWYQGEQACTKARGTIYVPSSDAEFWMVREYLSIRPDDTLNQDMWVGVKIDSATKAGEWTNGDRVEDTHWSEPPTEHMDFKVYCGYLKKDQSFLLMESPCSEPMSILCKLPLQ